MIFNSSSNVLPPGQGTIKIINVSSKTQKIQNRDKKDSRAEVKREEGDEGDDVRHITSFPTLRFRYPLKLINSRSFYNDRLNREIGLVYVLSYGGGLVRGDKLSIEIEVDDRSDLLCLTQGSTKVFRNESQRRGSIGDSSSKRRKIEYNHGVRTEEKNDPISLMEGPSPKGIAQHTDQKSCCKQNISARIGKDACLFILPSFVTCFKYSDFLQTQSFRLVDGTSSLVYLDWFTSGRTHYDDRASDLNLRRKSSASDSSMGEDYGNMRDRGRFEEEEEDRGESWKFNRFQSFLEIFLFERRLIRDNLDLNLSSSSNDHIKNFKVYANLVLVVPSSEQKPSSSGKGEEKYRRKVLSKIFDDLKYLSLPRSNQTFKVENRSRPDPILWSFNEINIEQDAGDISLGEDGGGFEDLPRVCLIRIGAISTIVIYDWLRSNLVGLEDFIGVEFYKSCFN